MKTNGKIPPPPLKKLPEFFFMTSHLDSHKTTDINPEMLSGVQTRNEIPHVKNNIRGTGHALTNRKEDIFMQIFTCISEGAKGLVKIQDRTRPELTQP